MVAGRLLSGDVPGSAGIAVTRVAAVDCGTNTIRLLIADDVAAAQRSAHGSSSHGLADVLRRTEFVRLGQGIDASGRIAPEAMERTLTAARGYAARCAELDVERVRFIATSASRDAENAGDFVAGVRDAFAAYDVMPEVVSGADEARLSFAGATGDLLRAGIPAPYLVVDLGGGSTEFVRGTGTVAASLSTDMGSVRLTERHLHCDPPTAAQIEAATRDIDAGIDRAEAEVDFADVATLVGLAGSVTTITAHALRLPVYDRDLVHGAALPVTTVLDSCAALLHADRGERMAMPFMQEGRVDVIAAGALIWSRVISRVVESAGIRSVLASEADILDGIALSLVDDRSA